MKYEDRKLSNENIMSLILVNFLIKQIIMLKQKDIEDKIPSGTSLGTSAALTCVENKIKNVSDLVKKQVMVKKQKTFRVNISPRLSIINLQTIYLIQR